MFGIPDEGSVSGAERPRARSGLIPIPIPGAQRPRYRGRSARTVRDTIPAHTRTPPHSLTHSPHSDTYWVLYSVRQAEISDRCPCPPLRKGGTYPAFSSRLHPPPAGQQWHCRHPARHSKQGRQREPLAYARRQGKQPKSQSKSLKFGAGAPPAWRLRPARPMAGAAPPYPHAISHCVFRRVP